MFPAADNLPCRAGPKHDERLVGMSGHNTVHQRPVLQRGDILLKRASLDWRHAVIALGQKLGGSSKATTVHAAIYVGDNHIAESSGAGLSLAPLDGTDTWKVYRLTNGEALAGLAATFALHLVDRARRAGGFGAYGTASAVQSAFATARQEDEIAAEINDYANQALSEMGGDTREFFCSNYVVQCYAIASEYENAARGPLAGLLYAIPVDHERTSPADLAEYFDTPRSGWDKVGEMRG